MNKELLVDFAELSRLSIPCGKCKTRVLLDCMDADARIPDECPTCGEEYGDGFRATLQKYREVYRKLADPQGRRVEIRLIPAE